MSAKDRRAEQVTNTETVRLCFRPDQTFFVVLGDGGAQQATKARPRKLPLLKIPGHLRRKVTPTSKGSQNKGPQVLEKLSPFGEHLLGPQNARLGHIQQLMLSVGMNGQLADHLAAGRRSS